MAQFQSRTLNKWLQRVKTLQQMNISTHAANACYFIVLSVFPLLVVMLGILRYTPLQPEDLMDLLDAALPDALDPYAWTLISEAYNNSSQLVISVSALTALWSAGRGIYGLQAGLNAVYGVQNYRNWLHTRIVCTAYTFLFILVVLLTLILNVFGTTIFRFLRQKAWLATWIDLAGLRYASLVLIQTLLFCAMFMFLPGAHHSFWESLPGALLSSFGWMTASSLFSLYVEYFPQYSNVFGSVYMVALASFWLYLCINIVFYGGILNRFLAETNANP